MENKDEQFKKFINNPDLKTTSKSDIVTVDDIGKFKVSGQDPKRYMVVSDIHDRCTPLYINASRGNRGLMRFIRSIFSYYSKIKHKKDYNSIVELLNDEQENKNAPLTMAQWMAGVAEKK